MVIKFETKKDLRTFLGSYKKSKNALEFLFSFDDWSIFDYKISYYQNTINMIEYFISLLSDDTLKFVCMLKYIEGKRFSEIADIMCYSENYVKCLAQKAINELFDIVHVI